MGNYSDALSYAASFCAASERCTQDVLDKIERFDLSNEEKKTLIDSLKRNGFLNEPRFIRAFINDKFRFNKWGRIKLRQTLRQKGINESAIDQELDILDESLYAETLMQLLKQKLSGLKTGRPFERKGKLYRFALGRGFEPAQITACLKRLNIGGDEDNSFME